MGILNCLKKPTNINQLFLKCAYVIQFNRHLIHYFIPNGPIQICQHTWNGILQVTKYSSTNGFNHCICWKCGKERKQTAEAFCENCQVIQNPIEKENYFKLFQIEEQFNIDEKFLKNKFRNLQNLIHPDKFSKRTHEEQTISEEYSSLINKAHSDLQSPLKRAEHLLKLKGQTISENQTVDDPEFLMEVMTLNEEVEDAEGNIKKMKMLNEKNKMQVEKLLKNIDDSFRNSDIENAKKYIIILKYYSSISNRINESLRELGITD